MENIKPIDNLRRLYRDKKFSEFKREFYKSSFLITREEREKIMRLLPTLPKSDDLVEFCVKELGYKVIHR